MKSMRLAAVAVIGLMWLAACSKGGGANTTAAAGGGAAQAPASGPDTAIGEGDLPHLKAGYWEIKVTEAGGKTDTMHICDSGKAPNLKPKSCSQFAFRRTFLGGIVMDATCGEGGYSSKMHMTAQGDFNSAYSSDAHMTMTLPGRPPMDVTTHTDARWIGDCPAGEKPADAGTD